MEEKPSTKIKLGREEYYKAIAMLTSSDSENFTVGASYIDNLDLSNWIYLLYIVRNTECTRDTWNDYPNIKSTLSLTMDDCDNVIFSVNDIVNAIIKKKLSKEEIDFFGDMCKQEAIETLTNRVSLNTALAKDIKNLL